VERANLRSKPVGHPAIVDVDGGVVDDGVDTANGVHLARQVEGFLAAGQIADHDPSPAVGELVDRSGARSVPGVHHDLVAVDEERMGGGPGLARWSNP
jgi:hypothetical protein